MGTFEKEVYEFLRQLDGGVTQKVGENGAPSVFVIGRGRLAVVTVPLRFFVLGGTAAALRELDTSLDADDRVFLYEDRWTAAGPLCRAMLTARDGRGLRVYARNCEVRPITAGTAKDFLARNHLYGPVKNAQSFGLYRLRSTGQREAPMDSTPALVAVAQFTDARPMDSGRTVSYEWLRYASVKGANVTGGMGALLQAFQKTVIRPYTLMTYSDLEWFCGRSYEMLGFRPDGIRDPVKFLCNPDGSSRTHADKFLTDRKFRNINTESMLPVYNLGSIRYTLKPLD